MHIATKGSKIDISSEKKLEEYANNLSSKLKKGETYFLIGEMGVGKTTFVKYLINNLQIKYKQKVTEVTSPTFNIMNEYNLGNLIIKHYDLYRINSSNELKNLNLFNNDNEISLIEWPQIIKKKPKLLTEIYFEYENEYQNRSLKILN
jgi:tRNA threonylcarbamoyladenosine biosynthesis protein TsaE|tara:strand:- start:241 stop:684 length:444 start_codon:yes stop_codon:yes gene_type:complete